LFQAITPFIPPSELFLTGKQDDVIGHGRCSNVRRARSTMHGCVAIKSSPVSGSEAEIEEQIKA